jgi:hypothetical protein
MTKFLKLNNNLGQSIIELLVVIGLASVILPTIFMGIMSSQEGRVQQRSRMQALSLLREAEDATRSYRGNDWKTFAVNGTYHPSQANNAWVLLPNSEIINGFTRQIVIANAYRDSNGNASSSGTLDNSTKLITITVSWTNTFPSSIQSQMYLTRHDNLAYTQTTAADFTNDTRIQTKVTNVSGGEATLDYNNKAKWCSPSFSTDSNGNEITITLPDGPPVAVAATASATTSIPNDVFVATAPSDSSTDKLAYLTVTANTATPSPTLQGVFTMDSSKYSSGKFPSGTGLDNNFKTNDVKYYKEANGKIYALLATDKSDKEVVVVQINNGSGNAFQDPVNKIYKYWTFFNTIPYYGAATNDQAAWGYGAESMTILGTTGYLASDGYMYAFDLSNIDSKTTSNGLDMVGCRIELDGYDCKPNPTPTQSQNAKYTAGASPIESGTTWSDTQSGASDCANGGNKEYYADHQLSPVQVNGNKYIYVAVGAEIDPELDIVNVTTIPTASTNPKINNRYCGVASSNNSNSSWKKISSLDFDPASGTMEAANSVYAKQDGTRAYMSSNGGIVSGHGIPDSDQFYIIDTSIKTAPKFLDTWPSDQYTPPAPTPPHYKNTAQSGYYNGDSTNIEMYPRRAMTVLDGKRAVVVGQDGVTTDQIEPQEYQVLNIDPGDSGGDHEKNPIHCGGLNYLPGFNDLTSVSEADGDNYVYMIANTMDHQLKIIQGGPDVGIYYDSGTVTSTNFDVGKATAFNSFNATVVNRNPPTTDVQFQVAVGGDDNANCATYGYKYIGPDGTETTKFATTSAAIPLLGPTGYQNPGRCFSYRAYFSSDSTQTPSLNDFTANYSP